MLGVSRNQRTLAVLMLQDRRLTLEVRAFKLFVQAFLGGSGYSHYLERLDSELEALVVQSSDNALHFDGTRAAQYLLLLQAVRRV